MTDPIFSDSAFDAMQFALDGLARRQELIGQNLSNVDTPGYQAQEVNFESALRKRLEEPARLALAVTRPEHLTSAGQPAGMQVAAREAARVAARKGGSARADGNNVDIENELRQMAETGIRYQTITQLASKKLVLLRTIANSR